MKKKLLHWTQRPENKARLQANARRMQKGKRLKKDIQTFYTPIDLLSDEHRPDQRMTTIIVLNKLLNTVLANGQYDKARSVIDVLEII